MPARTVDCPFIVNLSVVIIIGGESPNFIITVMYLLGSNLLPLKEMLPWSLDGGGSRGKRIKHKFVYIVPHSIPIPNHTER